MTCTGSHHHGGRKRPTCRLARRRAALLAAALGAMWAGASSAAADPTLRIADLVELQKRFAKYSDTLPGAGKLGMAKITAYEENKYFVFITGPIDLQPGEAAKTAPVLRRVIFLKPATCVVNDRFIDQPPGLQLTGSSAAPKLGKGDISLAHNDMPVSWKMFYPGRPVARQATRTGDTYSAAVRFKDGSLRKGQFVHVIHLGPGAGPGLVDRSQFERRDPLPLLVNVGQRTFCFDLCGRMGFAEEMQILEGGKPLLPPRLLPAGILPHGTKGVRMLERWDRTYQGNRRAPWDTQKAATELKKAIESGKVRPGKAVVLGCGAGTNAVYLASKGFDVTAIDLAPTALAIGKTRAAKARVRVRWVLASVLAAPKLGPFDFLFDRGCYHGVRRVDAKGFVAAARALCKPGGQFLIIAGNANEKRHYGPPRVKEKEIRDELTKGFEIQWLRETRFDGSDSTAKGPLAWSIMLRRTADKKPSGPALRRR